MPKPVVAIVGRPNVGKSTFFNRCIGARTAIVDDRPGVTRDRLYREVDWSGYEFILIDTGGLVVDTKEEIETRVGKQAQLAIDEADVIVFMVDGKAGLHGADQNVANLLRRTKKPILLAVNKVDHAPDELNKNEFYKLGLGEPHSLSALKGSGGVGDLLDEVVRHFPDWAKVRAAARKEYDEQNNEEKESAEPVDFSLAIVGRPNVGKSSLVNLICGANRSIVSDVPGTTRDAIDTTVKVGDRVITLIDTAGIRRKSRVDYGIEAFSVVRSLRAISRADVAVLLLDVSLSIADQDQKIGAKIEEAGKAVVIVLNKWDLIEERSSSTMNQFIDEVRSNLRHLGYAEIVFTSCETKKRLTNVLEAAERALSETHKRIGTSLVNQVINEAVSLVPPPSAKRGRRLRIYYSTQVTAGPPTFVLFVNDGKLLQQNYRQYLERKLREAFGFVGTPIRLITRNKKQ
jgi:GTPase